MLQGTVGIDCSSLWWLSASAIGWSYSHVCRQLAWYGHSVLNSISGDSSSPAARALWVYSPSHCLSHPFDLLRENIWNQQTYLSTFFWKLCVQINSHYLNNVKGLKERSIFQKICYLDSLLLPLLGLLAGSWRQEPEPGCSDGCSGGMCRCVNGHLKCLAKCSSLEHNNCAMTYQSVEMHLSPKDKTFSWKLGSHENLALLSC